MNKRDETRKGILFEVFDQPVTTIDALVERCHRALSAEIWITCCWPEAATGWKVGDFNYLVVAVTPDSDTNLYVQFWSEPQEPVLNEVCSGAWCPGAIRYIGPTERSALEARGYIVSGRAHNYSRRLVIDSAAKAEAAALETLQVMFDSFGYRGQWPLQIERHRGERAEHDPVVTSLTAEDFAKLAASAGFSTSIPESTDAAVVLLERGRQRFAATLVRRLPDQGLYSAILLQALVRVRQPISGAVVAAINGSMRFVKLCRAHDGTLAVEMALSFDGGVTMKWVMRSLDLFAGSARECARLARRGIPFSADSRKKVDPAPLVH